MPLTYEQNKKHIYKWRENNIEKNNALARVYSLASYHRKQQRIYYYSYDKVCREFRKIDAPFI
jgi:hypothetical protein